MFAARVVLERYFGEGFKLSAAVRVGCRRRCVAQVVHVVYVVRSVRFFQSTTSLEFFVAVPGRKGNGGITLSDKIWRTKLPKIWFGTENFVRPI